jgi:hypothetical protein
VIVPECFFFSWSIADTVRTNALPNMAGHLPGQTEPANLVIHNVLEFLLSSSPTTMLPLSLSSAATTVALIALSIVFFHYILSGFVLLVVRQRRSPLRFLRGPPSPSFFIGNLAEMHDQENNNLIADWEAAYGPTFVYKGFIGGCRLMTTDPAAVAHILGNAYDYPKPDFIRDSLATMIVGHDGLLTVEGDVHRRQVRRATPKIVYIVNVVLAQDPGLSHSQIRIILLFSVDYNLGSRIFTVPHQISGTRILGQGLPSVQPRFTHSTVH